MRVKLREVVDFESGIDHNKLSPFQMISVAFSRWYRQSKRYERKLEEKLTRDARERIRSEENLKEELLSIIYKVFREDVELQGVPKKIKVLTLSIDRYIEKDFHSIKNHKEFSEYSMTVLDCDKDMLRSFPNIRMRVEVRGRVLVGDSK